jgi:hypothetical protein
MDSKDTTKVEKSVKKRRCRVSGAVVGLPVGKKWLIGNDSLNITVFKKTDTKKGGVRWDAESFHSTLHGALQWLIEQGVRDADLSDVKMLCAKLDQIFQEIRAMPNQRPPGVCVE